MLRQPSLRRALEGVLCAVEAAGRAGLSPSGLGAARKALERVRAAATGGAYQESAMDAISAQLHIYSHTGKQDQLSIGNHGADRLAVRAARGLRQCCVEIRGPSSSRL